MPQEIIDIKTIFGSWPKRPLDISAGELADDLARHGIGRAITASTSAILYNDDVGNDHTLEQCAANPSLIPAATMHPANYLGPEGKVGLLKEKGFRVFRFFNKLQGFSLNLYCFDRMLRDLRQAGLPCIIDAVALDDPHRFARLSQEVGLDIIVTGLGYTFEAELIALARDFPGIYFDAGRMTGPDAIELFAKHVGAHRLVYGSDYPFDAIPPSLLMVQHAELAAPALERILAGNVKELLRL